MRDCRAQLKKGEGVFMGDHSFDQVEEGLYEGELMSVILDAYGVQFAIIIVSTSSMCEDLATLLCPFSCVTIK